MADSSEKTPRKRGPGRPFQPGVSGNPKGRPPLSPALKDALLPLGERAVAALQRVLDDPTAKDADRIRAAEIVIERLLGKAALPIIADTPTAEEHMTLKEMMEAARELIQP